MIERRDAAIDHRAWLDGGGAVVQNYNVPLREFFAGHSDAVGDIRWSYAIAE
jgi:hypothetical protein